MVENRHQRAQNVDSGSASTQKPWKHSAVGDSAAAKSARTVSSLGRRLNAANGARIARSRAMPITRRLPAAVHGATARAPARARARAQAAGSRRAAAVTMSSPPYRA